MRISSLAGIALCCMLMTGCVPEKRVVWTADGTRAAVIAQEAIHLIDGEGRILKPRIPVRDSRCAWTRDGKRLVVAHGVEVAGWKEIDEILTPEQRASITVHAKEVKPRALAYEGDWKNFEFNPDETLSGGMQVALLMYLRDKDAEGLPEKLGEKWKEFQEIKPRIRYLEVFDLTDEEFRRSKTLSRGVDEIPLLMVSSDDKFVAFNMEVWRRAECEGLFVVSLDGGQPPRLVDENVAMNLDWSADGHSLAYVRAAGSHDDSDVLQLGSLCTRAIRGDDGVLAAEWEKREDRVGVLFHPYVGIEWLRDGRIFFSSVQFTVPATRQDMPKRWSVFSFDPRSPSGVLNILGANFDAPLDSDIPIFEVSPDERRILLLCKNAQVAIYEIATGHIQFVLAEGDTGSGAKIVPTWKNRAVCFAQPVKDESGEKWVISLWLDETLQPLSETWPEAMKVGWLLEEKKEE